MISSQCGRHIFRFSFFIVVVWNWMWQYTGFCKSTITQCISMSPLHPSEVFEVSGPLDHDLEFLEVAECEEIFQSIFYLPMCRVTFIRANNNFMVEPFRKWPLRIRKYLKSYSLRFTKVDLIGVSKDFVYLPMFRRILSVRRGTVCTSLEHGLD